MSDDNKSLILPLASLILGLVSVLATTYIQLEASKSSYQLKMVEITYQDKKILYTSLIKALNSYKTLAESEKKYGMKVDRDKLKVAIDLALLNVSLFVETDVYGDCETKAYEIVEKSTNLYYTKMEAAYLSEDLKDNYHFVISDNLESIRTSLRESLMKSIN